MQRHTSIFLLVLANQIIITIGSSFLLDLDVKPHVHFVLMESSPLLDARVFLLSMQTLDRNSDLYYDETTILRKGEHPLCSEDESWIDNSKPKILNKKQLLLFKLKTYPRISEQLYARIIGGFLTEIDVVRPIWYERFTNMKRERKTFCSQNPCDDFHERAFFYKKK